MWLKGVLSIPLLCSVLSAQVYGTFSNPLKAGRSGVEALAISPESKYIVTGSGDTTKVWGATDGSLLYTLEQPEGEYIRELAISWDASYIVGRSFHGALVWNADTGKLRYQLPVGVGGTSDMAISPDNTYIVIAAHHLEPSDLYSGAAVPGGSLRVWDAATGTLRHELVGHTVGGAYSVAISPNSKFIITGGPDRTVRIWDAQSGRQLRMFKPDANSDVQVVAISPDGRYIAAATAVGSGSKINRTYVWDTESEAFQQGGDEPLYTLSIDDSNRVHEIQFAPDSSYMLTSGMKKGGSSGYNGKIRAWDLRTGNMMYALGSHGYVAMAISPDSNSLVTGETYATTGESVKPESYAPRVWDARTGTLKHLLHPADRMGWGGNAGIAISVAFSPNNKFIVTGYASGDAEVWDAQTGKLL